MAKYKERMSTDVNLVCRLRVLSWSYVITMLGITRRCLGVREIESS